MTLIFRIHVNNFIYSSQCTEKSLKFLCWKIIQQTTAMHPPFWFAIIHCHFKHYAIFAFYTEVTFLFATNIQLFQRCQNYCNYVENTFYGDLKQLFKCRLMPTSTSLCHLELKPNSLYYMQYYMQGNISPTHDSNNSQS